jgi:hypothetical protein
MSQRQDDNVTLDLTKKTKARFLAQVSLETETVEHFASSQSTRSATMDRWLSENAHQEHWNAPARLESESQGTVRIAPRM